MIFNWWSGGKESNIFAVLSKKKVKLGSWFYIGYLNVKLISGHFSSFNVVCKVKSSLVIVAWWDQ